VNLRRAPVGPHEASHTHTGAEGHHHQDPKGCHDCSTCIPRIPTQERVKGQCGGGREVARATPVSSQSLLCYIEGTLVGRL
jgi:hypothetical protein